VSQLSLLVLQLGFLALLWMMVLSLVGVLRRDLYGTRVVTRRRRTRRSKGGADAVGSAPPRRPAPAPDAPGRLVITAGSLVGTTLSLGQAPVLIGRSPECTLVLTDDFASGRHARLAPGQGGWHVEDLGSTNGTLLNGTPLGGPTPVSAGSVLKIGRTVIELRR
jgi:hypothetical protein